MGKKIVKTSLYCFLLLWLLGCDTVKSEKNDVVIENKTSPTPQPTQIKDLTFQNENVELLCNRLNEIKKLPYRDPNDTDPIYEALIAKGKEAIPCLVEKITDETPMQDPRAAPVWRHYKVGDTSVFILVRLVSKLTTNREEEMLIQMLPDEYREEWKTNGVYAYFNYVSESKNRDELQKWWQKWIKETLENQQN